MKLEVEDWAPSQEYGGVEGFLEDNNILGESRRERVEHMFQSSKTRHL